MPEYDDHLRRIAEAKLSLAAGSGGRVTRSGSSVTGGGIGGAPVSSDASMRGSSVGSVDLLGGTYDFVVQKAEKTNNVGLEPLGADQLESQTLGQAKQLPRDSRLSSHSGVFVGSHPPNVDTESKVEALDSPQAFLFGGASVQGSVSGQSQTGGASFYSPGEEPRDYVNYFNQNMASSDLQKARPLFEIPKDEAEYMQLCRYSMDSGKRVCVKRNCQTRKHMEGDKAPLPPGGLAIGQTKFVIFAEPIIAAETLTFELKTKWIAEKIGVAEWADRFRIVSVARAQYDGLCVNQDTFQAAIESESKALNYPKTPFKRVKTDDSYLEAIDEKPFSMPKFPPVNGLLMEIKSFAGMETTSQMQHLFTLSKSNHEMIEELQKALRNQVNQSQEVYEDQEKTNLHLETRINKIEAATGKKPIEIPAKHNAPTEWGVIANLIAKVEELESKGVTQCESPVPLSPAVTGAMTRLNQELSDMKQAMLEGEARAGNKARGQEEAVNRLAKTIGDTLLALNERLRALEDRDSVNEGGDTEKVTREQFAALEARYAETNKEVQRIKSLGKAETVSFHGMNFEGQLAVNLFYETEAGTGIEGMLMDPHHLMEAIKSAQTSRNSLDQMQKHLKLSINSFSEATAISSFGSALPSLFCSDGEAKPVMTHKDSFLDQLPSWEAWNNAITGLRKQWTEALQNVVNNHRLSIHSKLGHESKMSTLCIAALSESQACVQSLFNFIDEYMRKLQLANFDDKLAFHLTTRLVKKFLTTLSAPRRRVQNEMTNDKVAREKAMLWANLQCLEIASKFKKYDYTNDPLIAGELVEFLTTNTGFSRIEKLELELKESRSLIQAHKTAASNAESKADKLAESLKKSMASFEAFQKEANKRFVKLETKK